MLFDEFRIDAQCRTKAEYLMALNHFLIECLSHDRVALLIIDEAQNLSPEMLEEVRLLSNLETPTSKLLQIMLVGQPELDAMLDQPSLRQLRQRIVLRHQLRPFDAEEVDHYIDERLRLAGYTGKGIFTRSARKTLFSVTGGVPRLVNVVCDSTLLLGYSREQATIDGRIVHEAAAELRLTGGEAPESEVQAQPVLGTEAPRRAARKTAADARPAAGGTAPDPPRKRRFKWFGRSD